MKLGGGYFFLFIYSCFLLFLFLFFLWLESSAALIHHVGHKFHEVFQLKQGSYADLPAAKISEMMKSNSLDVSLTILHFPIELIFHVCLSFTIYLISCVQNAPTQSLLTVVNGIIDESIEQKNGEIPHVRN